MKKIVLIIMVACMAGLVSADVIAYWESDVNAPTWSNTNLVTATSFKTGVANDATFGSNDGTYGSLLSPAASTALGAMKGATGNVMSIKFVNVSGGNLQLDKIHFDFSWAFTAGPKNIELTYKAGDLTDTIGTVLTNFATTASVQMGKATDYNDVDVTLSSALSDTVLANGEYATFEFKFLNATSGTSASGLDNIAMEATAVIPEPATIGMLGLGGLVAAMLRRMCRS